MMKAMILAAGRGERMRPLTDTCPKPLLKINDKALIEYHLIALEKAGIRDVIINHAWLGEQIESFLGNGDKYGLSISYSPESQALETAGGIIQALPLLIADADIDQVFMVINGDIFTDYDFSSLVKKAKSMTQEYAHLVMINNPPYHLDGDFFLTDSYLMDINNSTKKILKYTFSGIGIYKASFFSDLDQGKRALAPLLRSAMQAQKITGELYQGLWTDIGTPERLKELKERNRVRISE